MKALPQINPTPALVAFSLCCGLISRASAEPMHTPTKMPMANAESVGTSTDGLSRINEVMQEHVDAGHIQGAVTIVARRGKVVHFSTHGQMDVKKGRVMEPDAIFRMASSSKPVLGVAAMMMIEEGLIKPSDPVSKYIPEFANQKVAVLAEPADQDVSPTSIKSKKNSKKEVPKHRLVPVDTPVTIHHLLTHTSGIMSGGLGSAVNPVKRTGALATYIPKLAKVPLDFQPGTRWSYSPRTGLDVVARIIEIVSETPFDEFLRERIFNPLEMTNTYFNLPTDKESKRVVMNVDWAKSKGWGKRTKYFSASGGLSSAAEDYLHFEQMLLNGGELFGHRLLSPAGVKMMGSNQVGDLFAGGKKGQKGMGFGYTVAVTLDPNAATNNRGKGAFGWGGAFGTLSWTDPQNELVAVIMLQQPNGRTQSDFGKAVRQAVIE
jgi:CubicO group peptidase (beta-lactamase class C family)